jgi:drug/metabolite transporter (DMT)-like permease
VQWGAFLGVGIFASSYTWYISLSKTSFGGNAAVYQTAPVFVFILSVMLLGEKVRACVVFFLLLMELNWLSRFS